MVFSSIIFLLFFLPVFLVLYYMAGDRFKNIVILLGSMFFYAWGAPRFIFVILGTTLADFYLVRLMDEARVKSRKISLLCLSLLMNLGLLFYFKYSGFFVENVNHVLAQLGMKQLSWLKLALPIGISFYTFETLTYVIDVYRGVHKPLKHFWDYQLYIILFPKLIAGPIIRFHDIADQIYDRRAYETAEYRLRGFYRFFLGLAKKVIIANALGACADQIFALKPEATGTLTAWAGALSYTFQIYFDFSGYSDMAIGLALMMGFRFPENFNNPYTAVSITDFWRRWHISLSSWFKDYLYYPLGGSRFGKFKTIRNTMIIFTVSGFWHGANWTFVVWGLLHGIYLVIENETNSRFPSIQQANSSVAIFCKRATVFILVTLAWVFFRAQNVSEAFYIIRNLFTDAPHQVSQLIRNAPFARLKFLYMGLPGIEFFVSFILLTIMITIHYLQAGKTFNHWLMAKPSPVRWSFYYGIVLLFVFLGIFNHSEFIYFQF